MNRELRIFLLAVGIPAVVLTLAGAWLVHIEWRRLSRPPVLEEKGHLPPPDGPDWMSDDGPRPDRMSDDRPRPGWHDPERRNRHRKPPPHFVRLFSAQYEMDAARVLWLGGCLVGLMFLSLVSGGWLLARAARRSRLEAMRQTDFVSNVSHEFKTPLTTICLCAELAQDDGLDPARRKKALSAVLSEAERLKRLVLNALDFSRLEKNRRSYDLVRLDVSEIVREVCATFSPRFPEGRLQAPEGGCFAVADAEALRQILTNLFDNAAKYAPGGKVTVTAASEGDRVFVSVADEGPGLSPEALRHAFDRFWRDDNSVTRETGGSGLGLAIARGLARGMNGDLTVANRKGGGAVFTLELKT